jgi:hypothetical protein
MVLGGLSLLTGHRSGWLIGVCGVLLGASVSLLLIRARISWGAL